MHALRVLLVGLLVVTASGRPAVAQQDDATVQEVERLAEEARRHYKRQEYAKSVSAYVKAYQLAPAAALLYNIAFIYDQKLHESDLAMSYYRRYVQAPDAEPGVVEKALQRMAELKEIKEQGGTGDRPAPRDPPPPDPQDPKDPRTTDVTSPPPARDGGPRLLGHDTTVGLAVLITGGVVLVAGGGLAIAALGQQSAFRDSDDLAEKKAARSDGQTFALVGDILMGVGAATALTGAILMATAPAIYADQGAVRVGASPVAGGALFVIGGALP